MPTEKPARLIERLLRQTKVDASRICGLEKQIVAASDEKNKAVDATAAFWQKRVEELRAQHARDLQQQRADAEDARQRVVQEVQSLTGRVIAAKDAHDDMNMALTEARDHISQLAIEKQQLEEKLAEATARVADVEPRIGLLEQQKLDLARLCDKVRDRMKRKELDDERAILNRKALAGAAPQPQRNFR